MAVVQTLIGNVKGPQGDTGATGPQGAQGEAATINVGTVSTTAYGNPAQVVNVGTESDAVLNFVIPQGKPGERTTTMGSLTLDTITTQTAVYPVPAVGDTGATVFGKIVKWFSDALTAITGKLDKSNVVNNLTTTAEGYALDARQGKALNDKLLSVRYEASDVTWTATVNTQYTWFYKIGRIVIFQIYVTSTINSSNTGIGTLPAELYPNANQVWFPTLSNGGGNTTIRATIQRNGAIGCVPGSSSLSGGFISGAYVSLS